MTLYIEQEKEKMNRTFDEAAPQRGKLMRFGTGLAGLALTFAPTAWADWTPPESSVIPPAVVTLAAFAASVTNGRQPEAPLVVGPDGALYGSTTNGGEGGVGTLFRVTPSGTFTNMHQFRGIDGARPSAALVVGPDGALYGSTQAGGTDGYGTVFRLETNGTYSVLQEFNGTNGYRPLAALVVGPDGALYGSTERGGSYFGQGNRPNAGTLFRVETNGSFNILHTFGATVGDGANPANALVVGPDGALYGSTSGTLFRLDTTGAYTNLHDFRATDRTLPLGSLVVGPDGGLYGVTIFQPGGRGWGTLFRLETNGTFAVLHEFDAATGFDPLAGLVVGPDGALYGSTYAGGTNWGTLFRCETNGTYTKLHDFIVGTGDGLGPQAALVVGPDGALYGSTLLGVAYGTLFRLQTNGSYAKLYDFYATNGANPIVPLVVGPDGALYGSAPDGGGGPGYGGILFKLILNRPPVAQCHDVTVSAGTNCTAEAYVDNGSFDPDAGDTITLSQEPPGPYPLGTNQVTLTVTDNHDAAASCTATVTVVDTTPPVINDLSVTPNLLWPPDHKMVEVTVQYDATDNCGAVSNVLSVTSNEAPAGTAPDWVVEDIHHVLLRAERAAAGNGRVYAITVISTDSSGNSSTGTVTVTVPANQK